MFRKRKYRSTSFEGQLNNNVATILKSTDPRSVRIPEPQFASSALEGHSNASDGQGNNLR